MNKHYVKTALIALFWSVSSSLYSQNVAINSTGNQADPSAGLDVSFNNKGLLPPRMTDAQMNAIAHPAQGLMVFDSTVHCLMIYSGNSWQSMFCACVSAPATPGAIAGSASLCAGASGVTYSVAAILGASSYTWTVPAGDTITSGQGTASVKVTFRTSSGNIMVTANNNCGTSAANTLAVTVTNIPSSVTASAGANPICAGNTLTLTGGATGATSWSWTGPNSFTSASQSPTITTITTADAGVYTLTASNSCFSAAPVNTASVTVNSAPAITGQPTSPAAVCFGNGTASFTVAATGTGLTYQWQEYISSWNNVNNGGVYSGVTTSTLTITNPPASMNGYNYRCVVSGTCTPNATSNGLDTLKIHVPYVPITLTNSQGSPTGTNFQEMLTVNSSAYSSYESSGLQNIEFTSGPGGTGNILQAWIESGASNNTTTTYWVNLGSSSIAAGGTLTIYMNFMSTNVMSASGPTGEAPQLSGNYGQYDNGANVFNLYANWAGNSLPNGWTTSISGASYSVNNGLTCSGNGGSVFIYYNSALNPAGSVIDAYYETGTGQSDGHDELIGWGVSFSGGGSPGWWGWVTGVDAGLHQTTEVGADGNGVSGNSYSFPVVVSLSWQSSSSEVGYFNYGSALTNTSSVPSMQNAYPIGGYISSGGSVTYYWFKKRVYPPNGVMPGSSAGSETCQ